MPAIARFLRERAGRACITCATRSWCATRPTQGQRLCEFLGLAWEPRVVEYGAEAAPAAAPRGLGDPITVARETRPTTKSLAKWAQDLAGRPERIAQAERILAALLDEDLATWGYLARRDPGRARRHRSDGAAPAPRRPHPLHTRAQAARPATPQHPPQRPGSSRAPRASRLRRAAAIAMGGLRIARIFGIPIYLHATWFVVFLLVALTLNATIAAEAPAIGPIPRWFAAGSTALLFFGSILFHELAHSLLARRYQIPVRSITLFFFGGVAVIERDAPTAARRARDRHRRTDRERAARARLLGAGSRLRRRQRRHPDVRLARTHQPLGGRLQSAPRPAARRRPGAARLAVGATRRCSAGDAARGARGPDCWPMA